jgi:YidC/Oxa1 family membrane protein insertase
VTGIPFFEIFATALAAIYSVIPSYGASIILLTIAVRLVLLPLSIKQTRSMREMQRIGPEVKRLQQKHKGDRQKLNTEMMALYKEHGVNPFGGCAPLLLQFPVLIALYWVIKQPLEYMQHIRDWALPTDLMEHALSVYRFLGMRLDCSLATTRAGLPSQSLPNAAACGGGWLALVPYVVLIAVMGLTTYYQQRQMQSAQGAGNPQAQQMQAITRIMPVFLVVIGYSFPAALVMYWTITNLWTIGQQRAMLGRIPPVTGEPATGKGDKSTGPKALKQAPKPKPAGQKPPRGRTGGSDGHRAPAASSPSASKKKKRR